MPLYKVCPLLEIWVFTGWRQFSERKQIMQKTGLEQYFGEWKSPYNWAMPKDPVLEALNLSKSLFLFVNKAFSKARLWYSCRAVVSAPPYADRPKVMSGKSCVDWQSWELPTCNFRTENHHPSLHHVDHSTIVDWAEVLCKCKKFLHFTGFVSLWPLSLTNSNFLTLWQLDCTVLVELQQCFLENFCPSSETQVREQALHMTKLGLYGFKMEQDASSKTIEQSLKNMLYRASYVGRVWADQVPLSQLVPMKRQAWADEFFT